MPQHPTARLPWRPGTTPLMLAPMQGVTNRAVRAHFIATVRPDVVFTEFVRVAGASRKRVARSDLREMATTGGEVPLVVQLVGHDRAALVEAAQIAENAGARHLNLNLGCPYGRMTTGLTGGALLQRPDLLAEIVPALRDACHGSFSIKLRAGYDNYTAARELLPLFETAGVDYLILHPRTVVEGYRGAADHRVTAALVAGSRLPVIANGDIRSTADGLHLLKASGAAGLMLGRGALADPLLFQRLRGLAPATATANERLLQLRQTLAALLERYRNLFCGDVQILSKIKGVLGTMEDPIYARQVDELKQTRTLADFSRCLAQRS
ncbi:MAG: dihydrouridine synthase [Desulfuromonadales bacterium GWD2_61_12]|nr:MAG: dihydrouridine synthase [Desulfuromonadales bacterium GWC2_61_20]OGR32911.1 MAG: dihydrouridine synthase [Desulfuromonadales bacterium GWD2_61_12]